MLYLIKSVLGIELPPVVSLGIWGGFNEFALQGDHRCSEAIRIRVNSVSVTLTLIA